MRLSAAPMPAAPPSAARLLALGLWLAPLASPAVPAAPPPKERARVPPPEWLGADLPLPLPVHTPQDLEFKKAVEKQYLVFNLLAAGKVAWDAGDFASAAQKWETLLALPGLDTEVEEAVKGFAAEARTRAAAAPAPAAVPAASAGAPVAASTPATTPPTEAPRAPRERIPERRPAATTVEGTVSGGGAAGPGGAVITLHRADGRTPRPQPVRREILQQEKTFQPHVVAVPVGSTLVFKNEDPIAHDVFSLSPAADRFNTGLYKKPEEREQVFEKPGAIELLCDIHAQMQGWVLVVDTPWFGQADGAGAFRIAGVPPGEYELEAWHESASRPTRQKLTVARDGARLSLTVAGDRRPSGFPPDKQGKPRQVQVGY